MTHNIYVYIIIAGLVTYLIRILPLTLIRKPIKNKFIRSFLHYVPYVTLSVMTFPAARPDACRLRVTYVILNPAAESSSIVNSKSPSLSVLNSISPPGQRYDAYFFSLSRAA